MTENTMSHIYLTKDDLIGSYNWKGHLDLLNVVMIGLAKELPTHDNVYELHRLLGALLSKELTVDEKLSIIENEYNIAIEDKMRKDVSVMCNLSQGIKEEGIAIGESRREIEMIRDMHKNGLTIEQISKIARKNIAEIEDTIASETTLV